ncbi:MAG: hypothetical protein ACI9OU_000865 [Candidatus Promineifilaceae bacterium]|jgi:hypothetical protein
MQKLRNTVSRRQFLASSGGAASLLILPSGTFGSEGLSPANKLNIAFVGMGSQIQGHVKNVIGQGHNVVAFCDVDASQIAQSKIRHGDAVAQTKIYDDYRRLFESEKSLDAVVIATPDHWHAQICKMAIEANLHVYCEKPLAHTVSEARMLRELSRKSDVVTQLGNQGSASANLRRSIELIQAGLFGEITQVHVWHPEHNWPSGVARPAGADPVPAGLAWDFWCGPSPLRPYKSDIYHPKNWRGWYDFGNGSIGDFCCHGFNLPVRALNLDYPTRIEVSGTGLGFESYSKSSTTHMHFPAKGKRGPVVLNFYTGGDMPPEELTNELVGTFGSVPRTGCILEGSQGLLSAGLWNTDGYMKLNDEARFVGHTKHPAAIALPQHLPRVADHLQEWTDAIRTESTTFSDFDIGGHMTEIGLAGVVALRLQKTIAWDGPGMRAVGIPEADALVHLVPRTKWL